MLRKTAKPSGLPLGLSGTTLTLNICC